MVWLKVGSRILWITISIHFNSNMVWLKATCPLTPVPSPIFQFQYGLIKSLFHPNDGVGGCTFQFQYGLIKSLLGKKELLHLTHFNSNMVWLKGTGKKPAFKRFPAFQFQYGLIKSLLLFSARLVKQKFQFQYGLIKRIFRQLKICIILLFQFQYGLIKRKDLEGNLEALYHFNSNMVWLKAPGACFKLSINVISIPIWSD